MTPGPTRRPVDSLGEGIGRWLAHRRGSEARPATVSITHANGGLSNETVLVAVTFDGGPPERCVLRLAPLEATFPAHRLDAEARVHDVVAAQGIPAPSPTYFEDDPAWLGAPFMVMPFLEGRVPGQAPPFDEWILGLEMAGQRDLHNLFIDTLAAIHRTEWRGRGLGEQLRGGSLAAELDWWQNYLIWSSDGLPNPILDRAMDWCRAERPSHEPPPSLLWGDPRLGNLILGEDLSLAGVLDWELSSIGPAEMDLAWYLVLDAVVIELFDKRVPGFPSAEEAITRYEAALGRHVESMPWHEVFALVRAMAITDRQARLATAAGRRPMGAVEESNPMVMILQRKMRASA